ncbi:bifunctional phosphopantothenoylcysteine decarboxylase/phosphopantothenate--cysteine ligase CoaBC [Jeotgalibaca sp. MA1X17-3]|uniref:bifunctional phosphopantothenoylcysteine decarboxylase/phosphopantothenate--cysteine ligase CoaBC n=1 Tax=Jeotgalibaca sp. MA1X17-3 TaxID=2908211 RepID=UPI001F43EBB0|nr:bifunctional phosphopantothenoylcysteine decarboxylase/phosphopantothenate--cysteine ligase CoaBC [Jeotgalibaca sp. MA1X17-3]UJF14765.1 bifunctional phosphopantothenoylcysteine decarboxylase/phosphopantothenate--cysteine ligase CoaBC [Jeotgalibaca sp. MA1X17-3]
MLHNKRITLFITGGIASYKAAELTRQFIKAGAVVRVVMTDNAQKFISPLTLQVLSKNKVYTDTFDEQDAEVVSHIHLADSTDLTVIAPATANMIAKMANGIADDMSSTTLLAITAPKLIVPAMNVNMLEHPATQSNLKKLQSYGDTILDPDTGFLAEGYEGKGRMPDPYKIVEAATSLLIERDESLPLKNKKVIIAAGGTKERIDPVRYITNDSSGKMGYSLATVARNLGAQVTLVSASSIEQPFGVTFIAVESARDMQEQMLKHYETADIVIMAAAVSDYRSKEQSTQKIKKSSDDLELVLEKNPDILAGMGKDKKRQFLIGFAAETNDLEKYAMDKLVRKKADMIVANDVSKQDAGFNADTNEVIIFQPDREPIAIDLKSKDEIAFDILKIAIKTINEK